MNLAEKLAREISRVTEIRCQLETVGRMAGTSANVAFAVGNINAALERAFAASGSNDAVACLRSNVELEGIKD